MKKFISYNESLEILQNITPPTLATQKLFITQAIGRILACDIIANHNSPEFPTSAMDGYAIKFEDQALKQLLLTDKNPAGSVVESSVTTGTCIKTFTGSLMPKGSDTLIPIENVSVEGNNIIINEPVPQNFATREVGESYKKDEVLIQKGTLIDFAQIGVMASLNIAQVEVYAKPVVAIASTGSEILDIGQEQTNEAQIRSSNHLTLEAIATKYGAQVHQMGVVKDDKDSITNLLQNALKNADIVVTTGGVSVGDYDYVKDIIKETLGANVLFQGVNIKPGQHILFAQKEGKFIIGLPGFAYSSTVTFLLYVLPLIFKYKGSYEVLEIIDAIIEQDFAKKAPKTIFTACNLHYKNGNYTIDFKNKKQGTSAILTNLLGEAGLLIQNVDSCALKTGDTVKVIKL
ncbi:MAG: molybdopterin molybdotransferase MoeA [Campylobacterota bacterium]|nr:molybdopterin molybdotransferase MoeA [Campylobacterota bacterium]